MSACVCRARSFVQRLAGVWYDFDTLAAARRRPFKSWERAHRTIWELTWALTNNTAAFGRSRVARGEFPDDAAEAAAYEELLERLNL